MEEKHTHRNSTHGMTNTAEFAAWSQIRSKCYNVNNTRYPDFGGRGIVVCERWKNSFAAFFEDLGKKPERSKLMRRDETCPFCKENCFWMQQHGMAHLPEHSIWVGMRQRCYNPKTERFDRYGGRGISVCDRGNASFKNFYEDMGTRPSTSHSIERINNDGNYCPENCKWATQAEQSLNTRRNHIIEHDGKSMPLTQWAKELNINVRAVRSRVQHEYNTTERVLSTQRLRKPIPCLEKFNLTLEDLDNAVAMGISKRTLFQRIRNGWPVETAKTSLPRRGRNRNLR